MESNGGIPVAGMMPGMLGLEMPLHQQQSQQQQHRHIPQHHQMPLFAQQQQAARHPYATIQRPPSTAVTTTTTRQQHASSYSDEEEAASGCGAEDGSGEGKQRGGSPWQRMKWTDEMVRLLIMVVFLVGDDSGRVDASSSAADVKKKNPAGSGSSGGAGAIQKKGKWKSVSRAILEKGFRVSPQQCEDKFNDLNKRYKRVVDIVGKGTSCRVVQNPSLLETMDHISPKLKEEVRKLLNSKHLFFREMCAYHSSITHQPCDADQPLSLPANSLHQPPFSRPNDPLCIDRDHTDLAIVPSDSHNHHVEDEDDDDLNNEGDGDSGDQDNELGGGDDVQGSCRKRLRRTAGHGEAAGLPCSSLSPIHQQLRTEMASVLQDGGKSVWEQRLWVRSRSMLLEEQKVSYQCRAFEIEKQRFKWQKYSRKKEREFEGLRLENERLRLENERMILVFRQKEMEIDGMIKRSEPSNITG